MKYLEKNNIYNIDAISLIKKIKKEGIKVDLIITDPPYNISRKNNFNTIGRNGIDFGEWDKNFNQVSWLKNISSIVSDNGSILIFNDWKNMGAIASKLEDEGFEVKDLIRWEKPAPMPRNTNRRYVTDFEFIIWAVKKGSKWTFNKEPDKIYLKPSFVYSPPGASRIHPTQKPEGLIRELISIHSNEGDLILDLFSGSGVISNVAMKMDRYYLASEINVNYYQSSLQRISKNYIRPPFNHLGNKGRILHELISRFPKKGIVNFIEPFAGSGIVSISYQTPKKYWLNDKDKYLSQLLKYILNNDKSKIISDINKIIKRYKLPIEQKKDYEQQYRKLNDDYNKDKKIEKLLVLVLFGFNQQIRFNSNNEFNIPVGKFFWNDYHKEKIEKFIDKKNNKNFEIQSMDFEEFVKEILNQIDKEDSVFYFDPPYLLSSATYNREWDEKHEIRLIELLQFLTENKYKWFLSNVLESKNKTNNLLKSFIKQNKSFIRFKKIENINYHNSNYQRKNKDATDVEVIVWSEYE